MFPLYPDTRVLVHFLVLLCNYVLFEGLAQELGERDLIGRERTRMTDCLMGTPNFLALEPP